MALDENGLTIRRQPEVLADLITALQANVDPNIDTSDDTFLGQLIQVIASSLASEEALSQSVYDNFNALKAEGKNLDDLAALVGLTRIDGNPTTGLLNAIGSDGAIIPAGSIFANPITQQRFVNDSELALSTLDCISSKYSVKTLLDNTEYTITVNGTIYSFTSDGTATELEILDGLKAQIDLDSAATWTAVVDTPSLQIEIATSDTSNIAIASITFIGPDEVVSATDISSEGVGPVLAPADTVTQIIVGPAANIDSVTNPLALTTGNVRESDEDLRNRILNQQEVSGTATVEAIQATLREVAGVTTAIVIENDQIVVDGDGRPPKSFESIVEGGADVDVATSIWLTKPAGIETFGNTATIITDSNGQQKTINYSRPVALNFAVRVSYTTYDEESFPVGGAATIAQVTEDHVNGLGVDVDVITGRFFGPIYSAVEGINTLLVEIQTIASPGDVPVELSWTEDTIPVGITEFASTTSLDIIVQEV